MTKDKKEYKNGVNKMATTIKNSREHTLEKTLLQSIKEVHLIQSGKLPKKSWKQLKAEITKEKQY